MGSSTKKKKEKQKDFQKPKLRVGKAKAKPSNFTDTSFRAKAIVVKQQSLNEAAPDRDVQFRHHLDLAVQSRSDSQRRDSLAYLTSQLSDGGYYSPVGTAAVLDRLLPLITDTAAPVRAQLLKLVRALPPLDISRGPAVAGRVLLYVRAGVTHLSAAVRDDALGFLEWLLDVAGEELVSSCPGGWLKTLGALGATMGWAPSAAVTKSAASSTAASFSSSGWSAAPKTSFAGSTTATLVKGGGGSGGSSTTRLAGSGGGQVFVRQIAALTRFLEIGLLRRAAVAPYDPRGYWANLYGRPTASVAAATISPASPFGHLNLFGAPRDEDGEIYADRADRQRVFARRWQAAIARGIEDARREGGAAGRAAAALDEVVRAGMEDYSEANSAAAAA